jgi:hypothetical protein
MPVHVSALAADRIDVAPSPVSIVVGTDAQLTMTPYAGTQALRGRTATWRTGNNVVQVDPATGVIHAAHMGSAPIFATVTNADGTTVFGRTDVEVVAPSTIASMSVTPVRPEFFIGEQTRINIGVLDAQGTAVDANVLDYDVTVVSGGEHLDLINLPGVHSGTGRIALPIIDTKGVSEGDVTLRVQVPGTTVTQQITVSVKTKVDHLSFTSGTVEILLGGSGQYTAMAFDAAGTPLSTPITWSSSNEDVATVDATGTVTGIAEGTTNIVGLSYGRGIGREVHVVKQRTVQRVELTAPAQMNDIDQVQLGATIWSIDNIVITGRSVTWTGDTQGNLLLPEGRIVGFGHPGTVTVSATVDGVTGSATILFTKSPIASVVSDVPRVTLTPGEREQFEIHLAASNNAPLYGRDVVWSSSRPDLVAVSQDPDPRLVGLAFVGVLNVSSGISAPASVTVTATVEGVAHVVSDVTVMPALGKVVLGSDIATLADEGFANGAGAGPLARNVASWFSGGDPSRFAVCNQASTFHWTRLVQELTQAGHTVDADCSLPARTASELATTYSGVFITGSNVDPNYLADYVRAGGSVYVAGNSGSFSSSRAEESFWNLMLSQFGLTMFDGQSTTRSLHVVDQEFGKDAALRNGVTTLYAKDGANASALFSFGSKRTTVTQFQSSSPFYRPFASFDGGRIAPVAPPAVASVAVLGPSQMADVGNASFNAVAKSANGTVMTGRTVTWKVDLDGNHAQVDNNGTVYGMGWSGPITVTATVDGVSGSAVVVRTPSPVASVSSDVPRMTMTGGDIDEFRIQLRSAEGANLLGRDVVWSSSRPDLITVQPESGPPYQGNTFAGIVRTAPSIPSSATALIQVTVDGRQFPASEITLFPAVGKLIVGTDMMTLADEAFTSAPGTAQFARNVAGYFSGGAASRFLFCNPTLSAWTRFEQTLIDAGHNADNSCSMHLTTAELAATYSAIFVTGRYMSPEYLADYVRLGGSVYVAGNSGHDFGIQSEDTFWNTLLLHQFGLSLYDGSSSTRSVHGVTEAIGRDQALIAGVNALYAKDGAEGGANWTIGVKRQTVTQFQTSSPFYRAFASFDGGMVAPIRRWFLQSNGDFILWSGESLWSPNGRYQLLMQQDCNLVEYDGGVYGGHPIWSTGTNGRGSDCYAVLQGDGNFVVYRNRTARPEYALWGSGVYGNDIYHLVIQDDGRIVRYRGSPIYRREAVWSNF